MTDDPCWMIMIRDPGQPWRVHRHHKSMKPIRYKTVDGAGSQLRDMFFRKWKAGNAKAEREDRIPEELLKIDT